MHAPPTRERSKSKQGKRVELGILLPVYNEEGNLNALMNDISLFKEESGIDGIEVVFVDDGSTDGTKEEITSILKRHPDAKLLVHQTNTGYGAAVRSGLERLKKDRPEWILMMDADGTMNPRLACRFRERILGGDDLVIGCRYQTGIMKPQGLPWWRYMISWTGSRVAHACLDLPIKDYTLGMRAFRISLAEQWNLDSSTFAILLEMVIEAKRLGACISSVPVDYQFRYKGISKFHYRPHLIIEYLRYAFRGRQYRR
jgi:glycosyltransferase involved in cell wall biosynthesis